MYIVVNFVFNFIFEILCRSSVDVLVAYINCTSTAFRTRPLAARSSYRTAKCRLNTEQQCRTALSVLRCDQADSKQTVVKELENATNQRDDRPWMTRPVTARGGSLGHRRNDFRLQLLLLLQQVVNPTRLFSRHHRLQVVDSTTRRMTSVACECEYFCLPTHAACDAVQTVVGCFERTDVKVVWSRSNES